MQCDFRKRQKMVKSIKNQTLPAKIKEKRVLAFMNEKTRSCFFLFKSPQLSIYTSVGIGSEARG